MEEGAVEKPGCVRGEKELRVRGVLTQEVKQWEVETGSVAELREGW